MEVLKKKMCVGFEKRADWEAKLTSVLEKMVTTLRLELDQEETARLAAIPGDVTNLIYAGLLDSLVLEFAGESCEVVLEYYPGEDEQDDLDLSLLDVVDWDVDSLLVRILVRNASYAEAITGPALMPFCSDRLTVRLEEAGNDEHGPAGQDSGEPPTEGKEEKQVEDERKEAD